MNLTPNEREEILADYVESCYLQAVKSKPIKNKSTWLKSCRDAMIVSIRAGHETWVRIANAAAQHRLSR